MMIDMTELNKYGGFSPDPYDAKKAKAMADMVKAKTHFTPVSFALATIQTAAAKGLYNVALMGNPWDQPGAYRDEMMMHLRDRGFTTQVVEQTRDQYAHVQVGW